MVGHFLFSNCLQLEERWCAHVQRSKRECLNVDLFWVAVWLKAEELALPSLSLENCFEPLFYQKHPQKLVSQFGSLA